MATFLSIFFLGLLFIFIVSSLSANYSKKALKEINKNENEE
jgi:hypothetical protein